MNKYTDLLKRSNDIIDRLKAADRTTHAIWDHLLQDAITEIQTLRAIVSEIEEAEPMAALQDDTELKRRLEYKISACYFPGVNELELTWERISDGEVAAITVPVTPEQGKAVSSVIGPCVYYSAVSKSAQTEVEQLHSTLTAALNWYERQAQSTGDFEMVERMKRALHTTTK